MDVSSCLITCGANAISHPVEYELDTISIRPERWGRSGFEAQERFECFLTPLDCGNRVFAISGIQAEAKFRWATYSGHQLGGKFIHLIRLRATHGRCEPSV